MYNLLVVDDEPFILESLGRMLEKECQEKFFVYKAASATLALDIFENHRIDMLITDICMPGMDGFELLNIIETVWPDCVAVFLTGQSEFEYAQKAVHTKAMEFVLKMDGDEAILEAVNKGYEKLERLYEEKRRLVEQQDRRKEVLPLLKRDCIRELIFNEKWEGKRRQYFTERMSMINDRFVCERNFLLTAVFFESHDDLLTENDMLKTIESVLAPAFRTVSSLVTVNTGILLAQDEENKAAKLKGFLEIAKKVCEKSGQCSPLVCVYDGSVNLDKAADAFSVLQYSRFEIDDTEGIQLCGEEKFSYYTWNEGAAIVGVTDTERLEESLSNADPEVFFALPWLLTALSSASVISLKDMISPSGTLPLHPVSAVPPAAANNIHRNALPHIFLCPALQVMKFFSMTPLPHLLYIFSHFITLLLIFQPIPASSCPLCPNFRIHNRTSSKTKSNMAPPPKALHSIRPHRQRLPLRFPATAPAARTLPP